MEGHDDPILTDDPIEPEFCEEDWADLKMKDMRREAAGQVELQQRNVIDIRLVVLLAGLVALGIGAAVGWSVA